MSDKSDSKFGFDEKFFKIADSLSESSLDSKNELGILLSDYIDSVNGAPDSEPAGAIPNRLLQLEALTFLTLNEANRDAFKATDKKVVLYPVGLAVRGEKCKLKKSKHGSKCSHCVSKCEISELMKIAEKDKIDGYFIGKDIAKQVASIKKKNKNVGIMFIGDLLSVNNTTRIMAMADTPSQAILTPNIDCHNFTAKQRYKESTRDQFEKIMK